MIKSIKPLKIHDVMVDILIRQCYSLFLRIYEGIYAKYQLTPIFRRESWQGINKQDNLARANWIQQIFNIIPKTLNPTQKKSASDFTRKRKLFFPQLVTFILP